MALFTISDLHLSLSCDKPMDIFYGWNNYVERLTANWKRVVGEDDTVVIPGDLSWGLKLEDSLLDLQYLNQLPGKKVIFKGNHDLWWGTMAKLNAFLKENKLDTIFPVFNNYYEAEGKAICGSRGWMVDDSEQNKKIILREAGRLEASLLAAEKSGLEPIVFLHYPPVYADVCCQEITDVLKKHKITMVYHGHIHGSGLHRVIKEYENISYKLVSCDCIGFTPYKIL